MHSLNENQVFSSEKNLIKSQRDKLIMITGLHGEASSNNMKQKKMVTC